MSNKIKKSNQLDYIVKGFANKRRIDIIFLLDRRPELSVSDIAEHFNISYTAVSNHLLKMMSRGIVIKRNDRRKVKHALTTKGERIVKFLKSL